MPYNISHIQMRDSRINSLDIIHGYEYIYRMKKIYYLLFILFLSSCSGKYIDMYNDCYIDYYYGYDFSNGIVDSLHPINNDIVVQNWYPYSPPDTTYPSHDGFLWFNRSDNSTISIKDLGIVKTDTFKDMSGVAFDSINPVIKENHLYFIRVKDGYIKLIVTAVSPYSMEVWGEYQYSSSEVFQ